MASTRGGEVHDSSMRGVDRLLAEADPLRREEVVAFESIAGFDDLFEQIVSGDVGSARGTDVAGRRPQRRRGNRRPVPADRDRGPER
jgi:hypothetical protein